MFERDDATGTMTGEGVEYICVLRYALVDNVLLYTRMSATTTRCMRETEMTYKSGYIPWENELIVLRFYTGHFAGLKRWRMSVKIAD